MVNKKSVLKLVTRTWDSKRTTTTRLLLLIAGTSGLVASKGSSKKQCGLFVDGTTIVKKVNFQKHISESVMHQTAVLRLKEKLVIKPSVIGDDEPTTSPAASASSSYHGTQTTLIPYVQKMNAHQKRQLCKKFSGPELVREFP